MNFESPEAEWHATVKLPSRSFQCGHCDMHVASACGFYSKAPRRSYFELIYICPHCNRPNFFDFGYTQSPAPCFGGPVADIPDATIADLFDEARRACGVRAYTAAAMCCRKLLMNVAVSLGAAEGRSFVQYVDHLEQQGYVPPGARPWVDHIRRAGNVATHEIRLTSKDDAEELIQFTEMLLKIIYEFPAAVNRRSPTSPP